ncbi:sigma-70 family RNA polymerase sigma factor [Lacibacterium aquatile]|uniref:RNA polymerase sigma factor n=1 Tax=Lacibacterium aquatile TaxID=1168082 RepID=A0ABW5DLU2_9PROT
MLDFQTEVAQDGAIAISPSPVRQKRKWILEQRSSAQERTDLTLLMIRVSRDRNRDAFIALYGYYAPRLKSFMRKLGCGEAQAEDLAQEAMLRVWQRAAGFDPMKSNVGTWIFTIARNLRVDLLRQERHPEFDPDDPILAPNGDVAADDAVALRQTSERVRQAIDRLPPQQSIVVNLSFFEDQPQSEIAARLGIPLGTVKSRLRLAMKSIRAVFQDKM